ncbi:MAG: bifunctional riboflavin kinase/FAD synthetase [Anaerolineae bacterium]|nr:bifunctional riboflavin kinase/FAD synthetase [Anaerolineae bacterium]
MWVDNGIANVHLKRGSAVTIGAFDGVHRGHEALIRRMVGGAVRRGLVPVVVTFDPLPGQVLQPESYQLLSSLDERLDRIASLGVQGTVILPFDHAFMATPAGVFVDLLFHQLRMRGLWVGPDFALGKDREGNVAFLRDAGLRQGFSVHVFEETVLWEGQPVRSSRIRGALRSGDVQEANGCLGYAYRLTGTVTHGDGRGQRLGFPTANLRISDHRLLPANGVYVCEAQLSGSRYAAMTNIGTRPTFDNGKRTVEAYLLDFDRDIYGAEMQLAFLKRLRPELRFSSVEALIEQMVEDETTARHWLRIDGGVRCVEHPAVEPAAQDQRS